MFRNPKMGIARHVSVPALAAAVLFCMTGAAAPADAPKEVTVVGPVTVEGAVDATVVAMPPVDVHDLDNPAFSSFQDSGTVTIDPGFGGVFGSPLADPPPGTRMVIEYVSVRCSTPPGSAINVASVGVTERTSPTSTISRTFQIPVHDQGVDGFGSANFVGGQTVRLYSDAGLTGSGVTAGAVRSSGTGTSVCFFSVMGHIVPLPPPGPVNVPVGASLSKPEPQELILPYTGVLSPEALNPPDGTVVKLEVQ